MTYTPKPPDAQNPDKKDTTPPGAAASLPPSRVQGAWGATPNDADLTVPDLAGDADTSDADDAMTGADEPLLLLAEDELAEEDARAAMSEEAMLAATDMANGTDDASAEEVMLIVAIDDADDGEGEMMPPTDAGTIGAVADTDMLVAATDLELYAEIGGTEEMTDAELADAVELLAAMQEAAVESVIAEALGEAAELAAVTGEAVIVVVEDEVIGIASPEDRDAYMTDAGDATGMIDDPGAAAGVFGDDLAPYAADASDPVTGLRDVQAPTPMYTTDMTDDSAHTPGVTNDMGAMPAMPATAARMDDEGDEVDADAALSGMVGSMAVAPPAMATDIADAADAEEPTPGAFGGNVTAYATDADDPAMRMLNVQKRGQLDRDEDRPPVSLSGDAADTLDAMREAAGMRGVMGDMGNMGNMGERIDTPSAAITNRTPDGRESDPLDEGGMVTTTPQPDDTDDTNEARPLLDETADDTVTAPEDEPEPAADLSTENPSPLMSEEMLDVVEGDSDAGTESDAATTSAPPFKALQETGSATDVVRRTAPSGGNDDTRETMPADVQGDDLPVDTADESDTPPAPEPMVQFVAGDKSDGAGESADETTVAPTSPDERAFTATELAEARENTDSNVLPLAPLRNEATRNEATPPAPATPTPAEPPGALTEEELEQARVDTDEGQTIPEPVDEEPATGERSQSQSRVQPLTGAASGDTGAEAATSAPEPAPEAVALTPDELAQARVDSDSGIIAPEQPATDSAHAPSASPLADETTAAERLVQTLTDVGVALGAASLAETTASNTGASGPRVRHDVPLLTADDLHLFNEGTHTRLYEKMGSRPRTVDGVAGTHFAVWAPNARTVSVVGPFNDWVGVDYNLIMNGNSGIWEGFVPGLGAGTPYKYHISSNYNMYEVDKTDPFGIHTEMSPRTASVVWDEGYEWQDADWMRERGGRNGFNAPMSIYEVHIGSWRRVPEDGNRPLTYGEMAPQLADYVQECGFTHVEFMPVMEHPFYGSWGYQVTGYFAPTSRYGTPQDFAYLVDYLHRRGIGVILDWVPSHFPTDQHGLDYFDGTHLYEHADPRQGFHPDWKSDVFNYGRNEVRSFLMSSATYWLDRFHADGLRVDGVASMLYLDYSRNLGEWVPNRHGGRENLEAVSLLKELNTAAYSQFPSIQTTAEESTSWPMVSRPTYLGGLGFGMKWDMGWMHDTLEYMSLNPIHRQFHHNALTFRMLYSFYENFVLPLSHDEVVYLKGSLIQKMGGDDDWQKFANLRLLFGYQWAQSGKKLLFMGGEFAQWGEWNHDTSLDWHLLDEAPHRGIKSWIGDLNRIYRDVPTLHQRDFDRGGFEWIDANDSAQSMASFIRIGDDPGDPVVIAANFTPVPRHNYRLGVPFAGRWNEILNSDAAEYGGSGMGNMGGAESVPAAAHGRPQSLTVTVPPLGIVFFRRAYGS